MSRRMAAAPIMMASRALCARGEIARRLSPRLRPHHLPGRRQGRAALARRHVRPGACRLLGEPRCRHGDGHGARADPQPCGQDRGHQDLAARAAPRGEAARRPARRREDVHRRRFQLRRPDRGGRQARLTCAARHLRSDRAGRCRGAPAPRGGRQRRLPRDPRPDGARCRERFSRRRRSSTRRASSSSPG